MDNPWLVNATENVPLGVCFLKKIEKCPDGLVQTTGRRIFFLETLGEVFAKEATTAMGESLSFEEAAGLTAEVLLLSGVKEVPEDAWGGFEGFFFVTSS